MAKSNGNGRILFGPKEALQLAVLIVPVACTWGVLNYRVSANEHSDEKIETAVATLTDQQTDSSKQILSVQKDVETIKDDVKELKDDQAEFKRETNLTLQAILVEVKKK